MGDFNPALYPPPDVICSSYQAPTQDTAPQCAHQTSPYPPPDINNPAFPTEPHNSRSSHAELPPTPATGTPRDPALPKPDFLIVGLFALRLTQGMLLSLPAYSHRAADLNWLSAFLSPYDPAYDLARISGSARADFLATYPRIVSRMKKQDKFPVRFMAMKPMVRGRDGARSGGMSEGKCCLFGEEDVQGRASADDGCSGPQRDDRFCGCGDGVGIDGAFAAW